MVVRNTTKRKAFDIAGGTLTMTRTKRRLVASSNRETHADKSQDDFIASLSFLPGSLTSNKMLTLSVQRRAHDGGIVSSIPRLSVNFIRPYQSSVFEVVREGHLDKFKQMLRDGTASIRDHDEHGASLLHVSIVPCNFISLLGGVCATASDLMLMTVCYGKPSAGNDEISYRPWSRCGLLGKNTGCRRFRGLPEADHTVSLSHTSTG